MRCEVRRKSHLAAGDPTAMRRVERIARSRAHLPHRSRRSHHDRTGFVAVARFRRRIRVPLSGEIMNEADREWFVARMGHSTEQDGFTRIAGRLFGYLLLSEQPCSIQELAKALDVSKASVSTDARRLLEHGVLERVPRTEDRRDYYQIAPDFFRRLMQYRIARWENAHGAVTDALQRMQPSPTVAARLAYMDSANKFALEHLRANLAEWDAANPRAK